MLGTLSAMGLIFPEGLAVFKGMGFLESGCDIHDSHYHRQVQTGLIFLLWPSLYGAYKVLKCDGIMV